MSVLKKHPLLIRLLLLSLGIALLLGGIFRGEVATVFKKATHICMECIGIG